MNQLNQDIAFRSLNEFFQQTPFVMFGTGTSCALDVRFGMRSLRMHLEDTIPRMINCEQQQQEWNNVLTCLNSGIDLESSMNAVQNEELTRYIIEATAGLMILLDREYGFNIQGGNTCWPAISLIKRIFNGVTPSDPVLHLATPNYDLLAEYALEFADVPYINGFCGGLCRYLNWDRAKHSMQIIENGVAGRIVKKNNPHVRLYKVHGSLNTFRLRNTIVEQNSWCQVKPNEVERMMITPGTSKYERLHQNRIELLGEYDQAVARSSSFLFLGFGFNDNQFTNDAIIRKLSEQKCPSLIITMDSNDRIEDLVTRCPRLWLVCKPADREGTRIFNSQFEESLILDGIELWKTDEFTKTILGGL